MIYISLVAAVAKNGIIGMQGRIPWHIPDDLDYFRQLTLYHPVIMGRYTFESLKKPLLHRPNIVLSRSHYTAKGILPVANRTEALTLASKICKTRGLHEMFVIGGASIYEEFMPIAHKLYITQLFKQIEGDRYFPKIDRRRWALVWERYIDGPLPHAYQRFERLNLPTR